MTSTDVVHSQALGRRTSPLPDPFRRLEREPEQGRLPGM